MNIQKAIQAIGQPLKHVQTADGGHTCYKDEDVLLIKRTLEDLQELELKSLFGQARADNFTFETARNFLDSLHNWLLTRSQMHSFRGHQTLMSEYAAGLAKILARFNK